MRKLKEELNLMMIFSLLIMEKLWMQKLWLKEWEKILLLNHVL
jgi:hypothetical protein